MYTRDFQRPGDVPVEADETADQLSEEQARRAKVEQLLRGVDVDFDDEAVSDAVCFIC